VEFRIELRNLVPGAAELERPRPLQALGLEQDAAAGKRVEKRRFDQWCPHRKAAYPMGSRFYIRNLRDRLHCHSDFLSRPPADESIHEKLH
jgi:hypothetical protein